MKCSEITTILFDMDGVITSEYLYWDAAALTAWELLVSKEYYGGEEFSSSRCMRDLEQLHQTVFCGGQTIQAVKNLGVNTNWDLAWLVFCAAKILGGDSVPDEKVFAGVLEYYRSCSVLAPELYDKVGQEFAAAARLPYSACKRGARLLWTQVQDVFQHWFLGSRRYAAAHGKFVSDNRPGLNTMENPVIPLADLRQALQALKDEGLTLGIGTGRPREEILYPLQKWGIDGFFDPMRCVTYTEVAAAESRLRPAEPIAKPHPFVFLKGAFGLDYPDRDLLEGNVDPAVIAKTLVVGDAPSDLLAAENAGFPFAAVLTGVGARDYFRESGADLILDNICDLPGCFSAK